jgi:putative ABC transport system permease protein
MAPPGNVASAGGYWVDHLPERLRFNPLDAVFSVVTPGTFAALSIPLKRGRDFEERDAANAPLTAVINETLARKAFPGQDPIGHVIYAGLDSFDNPMKIVGVVGDVRQWGPARKPGPEIYMPYEQHTSAAGATLSVIVRSVASPEVLTSTLRRTVHELSPDAPVKFTTMEASLYEETAAPRFRTLLLGIFAALSLCLAIAGVYGATAYVVEQRSNEIGLRMAMGATPGQVLRLILKHGMALAAVGMTFGFLGSLAGTRLMTTMLFEVTPSDPTTYAGVAALLGVVVLGATYLPARRAAKLDPLVALRHE